MRFLRMVMVPVLVWRTCQAQLLQNFLFLKRHPFTKTPCKHVLEEGAHHEKWDQFQANKDMSQPWKCSHKPM